MATNTLAVVSQSGETLNFYDLTTGTKTGQIEKLRAEPHELCYDSRTNLLYVTHAYEWGWYPQHGEFSKVISVVDAQTRTLVEEIPTYPASGAHYAILDEAHDILYASCENGIGDFHHSGGIIAIDLKTKKVIKAIPSEWKSHWFVMTPDGKRAYTCNKEAGFISVIDLVNEKMIGKIDVPGGCEQPGISRDGKYAYFPTPTVGVALAHNSPEYAIKVIDTSLDQIVKSIPLDTGALTIHVDKQDRLLLGQYCFEKASSGEVKHQKGKLLVLSPEDFKEISSYPTDVCPLTLFSSPDGKRAFAANIFSGTVTVVDLDNQKVERTLDVDTVKPHGKGMLQGAHGLALIP
jgi:DNA-binding beta-propeller fold protein YncE